MREFARSNLETNAEKNKIVANFILSELLGKPIIYPLQIAKDKIIPNNKLRWIAFLLWTESYVRDKPKMCVYVMCSFLTRLPFYLILNYICASNSIWDCWRMFFLFHRDYFNHHLQLTCIIFGILFLSKCRRSSIVIVFDLDLVKGAIFDLQ